ncbi:MAG: aldehyde dehydrogenase, partial [Brevundimonas sp.]|nr:aldehyde dehydrogenase [Brevundimonas sp.]
MDGSTNANLPKVKLRIGSQELETGSGGFYDHINPATGKVQARVPLAGKAEMDAAVDAAAEAFKVWNGWKPGDRRDAMMRLALLIEQNGDEFARLAALDIGSALSLGMRGWAQAKDWTAYYAGWCDKLHGEVTSRATREGEFRYTFAEPYGVIGVIITWNGPLISLGMKVSPAIAAGNTLVVKPSEMNAHVADLYARLVKQAGIPDGVINMVPGGVEAGEALIAHPKVQKISFTGGPVTARKILGQCAEHLKPAVLELGGKSANLIFPDDDLDVAIPYAA